MSGETIDEEKLITLVETYPSLYDQTDKKYSDKNVAENIWNEIGKNLGFTGNECKNKWQTLRGSFRRAHKILTTTKSGQACKKIVRWKWYDVMLFLLPYMDERRTTCNLSDHEDEQNENSQVTSDAEVKETEPASMCSDESSKVKRKRKSQGKPKEGRDIIFQYLENKSQEKLARLQKKETAPNPLQTFFNSMYETVSTFPPAYQRKAKNAVFKVVSDLEATLEYEKSIPVETNALLPRTLPTYTNLPGTSSSTDDYYHLPPNEHTHQYNYNHTN